jgi:hypothetical protein
MRDRALFTPPGPPLHPEQGSATGTDAIRIRCSLIRGDRAAFLEVSRLITGFLVQWRVYYFRDEWDDLIQEVVLAAIEATKAQPLRKPGAILGDPRSATRLKFVDCLRRRRGEPLELDEEERSGDLRWPPGVQPDPAGFEIWDRLRKLPEE